MEPILDYIIHSEHLTFRNDGYTLDYWDFQMGEEIIDRGPIRNLKLDLL